MMLNKCVSFEYVLLAEHVESNTLGYLTGIIR